MMSILSILNELLSVKTNAKKAILAREVNNETLEKTFDYAYSPFVRFGISYKTMPVRENGTSTNTLEWALEQLDIIVDRTVTGHAAINHLQDILNNINEDDSEVIRRVVLKDLECNTACSLAKSTWGKQFDYKPPQMLSSAQSDKSIEWLVKNAKGDLVCELKADGARCMTEISNGEITSYSRNAKTFNGLVRLHKALLSAGITDVVIDGEIVYESGEGANRATGNGMVNRCINGIVPQEVADKFVYQVWDIVDLDVYKGQSKGQAKTLKERRKQLEEFVESVKDQDCIEVIEQTKVKDLDEAKAVYKTYVNKGFEGIILKDDGSIWENKRSKSFVKFKEKFRVDVVVTGSYPHKKDPTKIGGLYIQTPCGTITSSAGSGLKDKQTDDDIKFPMDSLDRTTLMEIADKLPGRIIELEVNGITECNGNKSFFLPIIKLWRNDKNEANSYQEVLDIMNL